MAKRKEPGGITPYGDDQNSRIKGISNVSKTVNEMHRKINVDLKQTESYINSNKDISEVQSSMNSVLKKLGNTIGALSEGVKTITITTAQATKDAVAQYSRAIGQDLNYNKQNFLAMTLARSTPIFGYFAAKFMETDVFKKAADRMKSQVAKVFSGVGNLFRRKKKSSGGGDDFEIPHMAKGGYVKKGGLAKLHPAEVVMPIDEILSRLDENMSTTRQLAIVARKAQLQSLGNMKTYVGSSEEKTKVGIAKGFLRAYSEVNSEYLEPDSKRQLRALLSIQSALGAQLGQWRQVWQKMLIEHPVFRNLMFLGKNLAKVGLSPFKLLGAGVKDRGGYKKLVSKDKNPMISTAQTLSNYAMESLFRFDNLVLYTKLTAEAIRDLAAHITKKKYKAEKGIRSGTWSILGGARKALNFAARWAPAALMGGAGALAGPKSALAGWKKGSSWGKTLSKDRGTLIPKWMRSHTYQREMELEEGLSGTETKGKSGKHKADLFMEKHLPKFIRGAGKKEKSNVIDMKKHMPKFYKKGAQFFEQKVASEKTDKRASRKNLKLVESQTEAVNEMNRRQKRKGLFGMLAMIFTFAKTMLSSIFGNLLSPITSLFSGGFFKALASGSAGAIATALAPIAAVLVSAVIGGGIGLLINKYVFKPMRDKFFDQIEEHKKKTSEKRGKVDQEILDIQKKKREGKATPEELMRGKYLGDHANELSNKLQALRKQRMGATSGGQELLYQAVTDAQLSYFAENYDKYDLYSPEERFRIREEWLKKGGGGAFNPDEDPMIIGKKREELFLRYLTAHGTPRYQELYEPTMGYTTKIKYNDLKKNTKEWAGNTWSRTKDNAEHFKNLGTEKYGEYSNLAREKAQLTGNYTKDKYEMAKGYARDKTGLVWNASKERYEQVEAKLGGYSGFVQDKADLVWNKSKGMYEEISTDDIKNKISSGWGRSKSYMKENYGGTAEELKETIVDTNKMIRTESAKEMAKMHVYGADLKSELKDVYEKSAEGLKQQSAAFNTMTTNISNNVSNAVSNATTQAKNGIDQFHDELTAEVIHGRMH